MKLVSGIVDSGFFAQSALSAEIATKDSLGRNISETYLTAVDIPESANWNSTYNTVHDNSASWTGGGVTGDFELSAGSGISIVDYPLEQKTVISVTAQGGNTAAEQAVIDNSATWNSVSDKLDTTAFSDVSGTFLTAHQDLSDYQTTAGMTAYQEAGSYLSSTDSANFLLTSDSGNFYPSDNPSAFITGVDLTPYQTTADMVNYQTTAGMTAYLTGVPDTYLQNTDLTITSGKITEISGVPLSAGDELPSGVMNTSALEYNAVNEISAYNGSAIAQYGAEKQWLVHDDTLVSVSNSAQYALGCNISALQRLMGVDETVLFFAGNESSGVQSGNLTESIKNFKMIRVAGMDNDGHTDVKYIYPAWTKNADGFSTSGYEVILYGANPYSPQSTVWEKWTRYSFSALTSFNIVLSYEGSYTANTVSNVTNNHKNSVREVVGIGRISG